MMRPAAVTTTVAFLALAALGPAGGQAPERSPQAPAAAEPADRARADDKARRDEQLRQLETRLRDSNEAARRLASELDALRADTAGLSAALLQTAQGAQSAEARIAALEEQLETIAGSEAAIRLSLESRRGVVAEVLAALQRLGREAGPAVLISPEDILGAIRSAMLLGSVVPGLREEVQALAGDLTELARLREIGMSDRMALAGEVDLLAREQDRLSALMQLRREQLARTERGLGEERARSAALGSETRTLRDLVDRLDGEAGTARRESEAVRRRAEAEAQQVRERFAAASARDPVRLAPKLPFSQARGSVPKPAVGPVLKEFGSPDGQGGSTRGILIGTRPKALVTAPADGWVSFAGPFRSFGRLLIINAGDGYYLLLAGMDQISVETGQFVLAGEPVGRMGETVSPAAAMGAVEVNSPALYVEFRKDGGPIDPHPWWAKSQSEKVRG